MKLSLKKAGASIVLAGALLFAAPAMAQAYVPSGPDTVTVTVTSSGPVSFSGFQPGASVTITLVGVGVTGANLATANLPVSSTSVTKTADSSGTATAVVTLPANPVGTYTLSATGPRAAAAGGTGSTSSASGSGLAVTGIDAASLNGLWIGGGALALAGASVAVGMKVRRNREESNA